MRIPPFLVATLATCVFARVHAAGPVHTVSIEQSQPGTESHLDTRDAPNNLDYRCGPKIGKCPVGTCCSGAGMFQNDVKLSSLLISYLRKASVARLRRTVALQTARLTTVNVTLTNHLPGPQPRRSLVLMLGKFPMALARFVHVLSQELLR
jgi:hypothetical protein